MYLSFPDLDEDPFRNEPDIYESLRGLTEKETEDYVTYRLRTGGCHDGGIFSPGALALIYRFSKGQPGLIDQFCSMALKCAFTNGESTVSRECVSTAAARLGHPARDAEGVPSDAQESGREMPMPAIGELAIASREFDVQRQIIVRLRGAPSGSGLPAGAPAPSWT